MTNYDGRCRGGWAFGQGFDSPQVHKKQHCRALPYGAVFCCFERCCYLYGPKALLSDRGPRRPGDVGFGPTVAKRRPTPRRESRT